jgi:type II secretory pathway predicted ATPase ExeA
VTVVKVNGLSKRDFCRHLATSVGAKAAGHTAALVKNLQEHVSSIVATEGRLPVLILDEAHDLRGEVLALLRLLTNFELDSRLVLSVILSGHPTLRTMLRRDDQEAVRGRIAHYCSLRLLDREESQSYIQHRLRIAGADGKLLSPGGFEAIFECARGNLRAIDRITLAALKLTAARKESVIDATIVSNARHTVMP